MGRRLALKAAGGGNRKAGEAALRDAFAFSGPQDGLSGSTTLGPAGLWLLAGRSLPHSLEDSQVGADLLGVGGSDAFGAVLAGLADDVHAGLPAPLVAARAGTAVLHENPQAETVAWWWVADLALSWRSLRPCANCRAAPPFGSTGSEKSWRR